MLFDKFIQETKDFWVSYFSQVSVAQRSGLLKTQQMPGDPIGMDLGGYSILYPNMLVITDCKGYYIAELVGSVKRFSGLTVKIHRERSIYRYFSQFDGDNPDPVIYFDASEHGLSHLCISQGGDIERIKQRFPSVELYDTELGRNGGSGSPLGFGPNFKSCFMEHCILINVKNELFRCKNILYSCVVKSAILKNELLDVFRIACGSGYIAAVHTVSCGEERRVVAGQLQSMVLFPSLHETTLGEFLKLHPMVLKEVFKSDNIIYEPYLEWIEHDGTCEDLAINPDLLVKREDGFYDIYDLKTALLDKRKITKNGRSRRGLISYVEEGIGQLANYREYFAYAKNAELAERKYSVKVRDPRLVLVVGSWENVDAEEVEQACRKYGASVQVVDYDTICHMFMGTIDQPG